MKFFFVLDSFLLLIEICIFFPFLFLWQVNINKQKKEAFQIIKPDLDAIAESNPHFDESMGINKTKLLRPKRPGFQFLEEGKMSRMAELQRIKVLICLLSY